MSSSFWIFLLCIGWALANVEKVIFVAPPAEPLPLDASIDNLLLLSISEDQPVARTFLNASFPTDGLSKGTESWLILKGLNPGRRYEVRVCWAAINPTSFWLYSYTMQHVFETPALLSSLTAYSFARHDYMRGDAIVQLQARKRSAPARTDTTFLFLQVFAAADYFSLNQDLMDRVRPVPVDIILDPYVFNIFPKSLVPTAAYLLVVALLGWFMSGWIYRRLIMPLAGQATASTEKKAS